MELPDHGQPHLRVGPVTDAERKAIRARNRALSGRVPVRHSSRVSGAPQGFDAMRPPMYVHPSQYRKAS
jgi:hypothetical protein